MAGQMPLKDSLVKQLTAAIGSGKYKDSGKLDVRFEDNMLLWVRK